MDSADRRRVHEGVLVRHSLRKPVDGRILVEVGVRRWPPRRLVIRWQDQIRPELKAEGKSHCTMELESNGPAAKLTITHTIGREPSNLIVLVSSSWPKVISDMKSLLETGSTFLQDAFPVKNTPSGKDGAGRLLTVPTAKRKMSVAIGPKRLRGWKLRSSRRK